MNGPEVMMIVYIILLTSVWNSIQSEDCKDGYRETKAGLCDKWAKEDYCNTKPKIMNIICRRTCNFCVSKYWSNWSNWGSCSATCASGVRTRSRVCLSSNPVVISSCKRMDGTMSPFESASDICSTDKCPECKDVELEEGCKSWAKIGFCTGHAAEMKKWCAKSCKFCTEKLVGHWDVWSSWSVCPVTCGGGLRTRTRVCISPVIGKVAVCVKKNGVEATFDIETESCNSDPCTGCLQKNREKDTSVCASWKEAGYCSANKREMDYWCARTCNCDE